ncbi:hypothetical protein PJK45_15370 [Mycobacterium kansasii]|uniref:Uncharacterized protein n=2 Tax=Mycobacterium kansasii TaxID=1768 RepID=U5WZ53_MYCKA|nr:hypothetical protein [Mycobacterium kansasii]AGZ54533.1 hypothetical protein MKAN_28075 [Mycobacterium kansasii ATCC 12478]ETZ98123.1 hypothetical protein I547_6653 [Mycobacterium kansasii 824]EUA10896.1 hypothetical protein I545_5461 [Mycobacterium kansasii 662]KEP42165.1 hypothetical protein MKSMC1_27520 [Mycobacterium kansasii]
MGQITHTAAAWRNPHFAGADTRSTPAGYRDAIDGPGLLRK